MTTLDLDYLRTADPNLYATAVKASGREAGLVEVSMDELKLAAVQLRVSEPQIDMKALELEQQRDLKARGDQQRAGLRLNEWATAGLAETQSNMDAISGWMIQNQKVSSAGVDEAIKSLGTRLTWTLTAAPKAPQLIAGEVLGVLSDGCPQLSLSASSFQIKQASKDQARDYLKRIDAQQRNQGRFGSRF